MEELVRADDMLIVEERMGDRDKRPVDVEELAVSDEALADSPPTDDELEVEVEV
jgi:hypothetical protein